MEDMRIFKNNFKEFFLESFDKFDTNLKLGVFCQINETKKQNVNCNYINNL